MSADSYDVVVCVGTLTHGHVGPAAFGEFVRLARPGGTIVATVLDDIWDSGGYRAEVDRLAQMAMVEVLLDRRRRLPQGGRGQRPDGGPARALTVVGSGLRA